MSEIYESFNFPEVNTESAQTMGMTADEFQKACSILGRTPNYIELGCISAMWSEHCSYKSSRAHLAKLPVKGENVVYGPGENAGVVRVDDNLCICFKIESHNHPSYHDPYNGAATGVGGILRDVFTMGATPVAGLNLLRFGLLSEKANKKLIIEAVKGMADYGNTFGVPMVGGETFFHKSYNTNPLVNAFIVGVVDEDKIFTSAASGSGNPVIYIGRKTGREGILAAAMASEEIGENAKVALPVSVKGDPKAERNLFEACIELMHSGFVVGIQDMGAAGLTSTSFEMAGKAGSGVKLELDKVPTCEANMDPYELMLSESQERMLLVGKKGKESEIVEIVTKWGLDAVVIGKVTDDGYVRLFWNSEEVAAVKAADIVNNAPKYDRPHQRPAWLNEVPLFDQSAIEIPSLEKAFNTLIQDPSIASKGWIWRQFDRPDDELMLSGSDAAVIRLKNSKKGIAISADCNSRFCYLNPRTGAKHAVAESARNVAASGAMPVALTNCLNYGNPEKPDGMYQIVEGIEGIAEAAKALDIPVVSGNVSLYNETEGKAIYPTPAIVVTGVIDDADNTIQSFFKKEGNKIAVLGDFASKIDASHYLESQYGIASGTVPSVNLGWHKSLFNFMSEAASLKYIESAHDSSEGGISVALFEMCMKRQLGVDVSLPATGRADAILFGEVPQMILEISPENTAKVQELCTKHALKYTEIGEVRGEFIEIKSGGQYLLNVHIGRSTILYEKALPEMVK